MCRQFDSSQHHNKPLKISGLFLFVTVFGTQWCREHHKRMFLLGPGHVDSWKTLKWCFIVNVAVATSNRPSNRPGKQNQKPYRLKAPIR